MKHFALSLIKIKVKPFKMMFKMNRFKKRNMAYVWMEDRQAEAEQRTDFIQGLLTLH